MRATSIPFPVQVERGGKAADGSQLGAIGTVAVPSWWAGQAAAGPHPAGFTLRHAQEAAAVVLGLLEGEQTKIPYQFHKGRFSQLPSS